MKRIYLANLADPRFPAGSDGYDANRIDYRAIIENAIRIPLDRQAGASIDEMRKGIRILDALDAAKDDIIGLEDADWEFLKAKLERFPWAGTDRRFLRFYDDVMNATESAEMRANGLIARRA